MELQDKVLTLFKDSFSGDPMLIRAPGRINFIGEHTDYNEGFVMPAAIDKYICFAITPTGDESYRLLSVDYQELFTIQSQHLHSGSGSWPDYILGVVDQYRKMGYEVPGFNCVFGGDIPTGAGLSSSAALECSAAKALDQLFGFNIPDLEMVKLCQRAENEFVGVQCGIMDQFASMFGKEDKFFKLDCRTLEHQYLPFDQTIYRLVLIDTKVEHSLASSEYNVRRWQCEQGVELIKRYHPGIKSLRDVDMGMLEEAKAFMDDKIYKRCLYVIRENKRLLEVEQALNGNNIQRCGELLYETHDGLRDLYEVSCPELDFLVIAARNSGMIAGARMMGGGFGGCTINLVKDTHQPYFIDQILRAYKTKFNIDAEVYEVSTAGGVEQLTISN